MQYFGAVCVDVATVKFARFADDGRCASMYEIAIDDEEKARLARVATYAASCSTHRRGVSIRTRPLNLLIALGDPRNLTPGNFAIPQEMARKLQGMRHPCCAGALVHSMVDKVPSVQDVVQSARASLRQRFGQTCAIPHVGCGHRKTAPSNATNSYNAARRGL